MYNPYDRGFSSGPYNSPYSPYSVPYSSPYYGTSLPPRFEAGREERDEEAGGVFHSVWKTIGKAGPFFERFARVSYVLESNWHALNGSWSSMMRLGEGLKQHRYELWSVVKAIVFIRLLFSLHELYSRPALIDSSLSGDAVGAFLAKEKRRNEVPRIVILGLIAYWATPRLLRWFKKRISKRRRKLSNDSSPLHSAVDEESHEQLLVGKVCYCDYMYEARHADEMTIRQGDHVLVLEVDEKSAGWVYCERQDGKRGLCPANHFTILKEPDVAPAD